jgi:hypothetical protein
MQDGPISLNEALPTEILTSIASYLEPAELANLRLVSRTFAALSDEAFDIAWQPHLEKLKQIDPTLSVIPPQGNTIPGWRQAQFKQHFIRITQQQMEEIEHFQTYSRDGGLPYQATFVQFTEPAKTLSEVLERDQLLNRFNADLIKSKIKESINGNIVEGFVGIKVEGELRIYEMGLTRFPEQLFEDDELTSYWASLNYLDLSDNFIKSLPDILGDYTPQLKQLFCHDNQLSALPNTLGNCTMLKQLYCYRNELTTLPATIGNCIALKKLECSDNQLTSLPDTLGNCIALKKLDCSDNQLTSLPATLGNCTALKKLECSDNELTALPPSLANCDNLQKLFLADNFLKTIPSEIRTQFEEDWYQNTMTSQKSPPVLSLDQEFNPILFSSGVQRNNPVENEGTSAPENSALVNKTYKL